MQQQGIRFDASPGRFAMVPAPATTLSASRTAVTSETGTTQGEQPATADDKNSMTLQECQSMIHTLVTAHKEQEEKIKVLVRQNKFLNAESQETKRKLETLEKSTAESFGKCALLPEAPSWDHILGQPNGVRHMTMIEQDKLRQAIKGIPSNDRKIVQVAKIAGIVPKDKMYHFDIKKWSASLCWRVWYCVFYNLVQRSAVQNSHVDLVEKLNDEAWAKNGSHETYVEILDWSIRGEKSTDSVIKTFAEKKPEKKKKKKKKDRNQEQHDSGNAAITSDLVTNASQRASQQALQAVQAAQAAQHTNLSSASNGDAADQEAIDSWGEDFD